MKYYNERPANSRDKKEDDDRKYRAEVYSLNMGGQNAEVGQYIGVPFVPMRVVNRITTPGGVRKNAFSIDGFDPDTGKPGMIFFDTKLRQGSDPANREYVQNFGGGIAMTLCTLATPREAQEALEEVNEENGTDLVYEWSEWEQVGGLLKLKPEMVGKPMIIGKQFIKTTKGNFKMNVFKYDPLPKADYTELDADIDWYNSLRGEPYSEDEEEHYGSSSGDAEGEEDYEAYRERVEREEAERAMKEAGISKTVTTSTRSKPATRRSRQEAADDVAKEFNRVVEKTIGDMPKSTAIPDSVSDFIKEAYDKHMSTDEIVLGMIQDLGLKSAQAVEYLDTWLDKREGGRSPKVTRPVKTQADTAKPKESELVTVARQCKERGMDSPETLDVLNQKFPGVGREEKRAALKSAGLIKI